MLLLLSFDIEEFDIAEEYGQAVDFDTKIRVSSEGTVKILDILARHKAVATFFVTACFAENRPDLVRRIVAEGHELASHGYYHSSFEAADFLKSKLKLEEISGVQVNGFRMARMDTIDTEVAQAAGYVYDSSINPTWLPGRYDNRSKPRNLFKNNDLWIFPTSVTPIMRFPLFWLSFKNLPAFAYNWLAQRAIKTDGYLNVYFHPWEFCDLSPWELPAYVKSADNDKMVQKLENFMVAMQKKGHTFGTLYEYIRKTV
jgi:peptidoglycan/xylan/chitin deacetylase (PgdA/CDA1 family)